VVKDANAEYLVVVRSAKEDEVRGEEYEAVAAESGVDGQCL
jgi:hypothetical protein